jgi:hypothetical protein
MVGIFVAAPVSVLAVLRQRIPQQVAKATEAKHTAPAAKDAWCTTGQSLLRGCRCGLASVMMPVLLIAGLGCASAATEFLWRLFTSVQDHPATLEFQHRAHALGRAHERACTSLVPQWSTGSTTANVTKACLTGGVSAIPASENVQSQRLFEAALALAYSFNQAQATRLFRAALAADPQCAWCAWGVAYCSGPYTNLVCCFYSFCCNAELIL